MACQTTLRQRFQVGQSSYIFLNPNKKLLMRVVKIKAGKDILFSCYGSSLTDNDVKKEVSSAHIPDPIIPITNSNIPYSSHRKRKVLVMDASKGNGGPPILRSPPSSSLYKPLFVDCSVEYELPNVPKVPKNSLPLLVIHPGYEPKNDQHHSESGSPSSSAATTATLGLRATTANSIFGDSIPVHLSFTIPGVELLAVAPIAVPPIKCGLQHQQQQIYAKQQQVQQQQEAYYQQQLLRSGGASGSSSLCPGCISGKCLFVWNKENLSAYR
ncbi:unnamed protein product [Lepeophtheirus salmonis]|uniref:(salmon louse) hypothetical protein n=1 Tax=Lepeophtheirus salmonis TaxID=72036 RepID=A0A7R8D1U0_LEPSM|nr:unnamed protein product [Lepeophtheirus salmonis]CAF2999059.1 unnamed protein product [Lepeophtheirus salmonis]